TLRLRLSPVEVFEGGDGHVDLAPHLDDGGRRARELAGDGRDGYHVGGDVLADLAVTARGRPGETPAFVEEIHGQTVDLRLAGVRHHAGDVSIHALTPGEQLLVAGGLVKRHHRQPVANLGEERRRGASDGPERRVGPGQLWP